jgi:tetratricopeptide (TPR) repeat protein
MGPIETCMRQEKWKESQYLIRTALRAEPESHWLWATLSSAYYEQFKYEKALECAERALSLSPHCPFALWHYAGALYQMGLAKEVLAAWKKLLRRGIRSVAYGECGEGIVNARSLLNDCNFGIATCYAWIGQKAFARRYFRRHVENRRKGWRSIYRLQEAKRRLAAVHE